jgi:hypothetical protein
MVRLLSRNTRKWPPKSFIESQRHITRWRCFQFPLHNFWQAPP